MPATPLGDVKAFIIVLLWQREIVDRSAVGFDVPITNGLVEIRLKVLFRAVSLAHCSM